MSVVLICGALLLFKSLARLQQVDIGARIDRVITMAIDLPYERYPSGHHLAAFYPLLVEQIQAIPGVVSASVSGDVPLEGTGGENLRMPGRAMSGCSCASSAPTPVISGPWVSTWSPAAPSQPRTASVRRM